MPPHRALALLPSLLLATAALAGDLQVTEAWVRGTVPAQHSSGAFMRIASPAGAALLGASSPLAETVELHEMKMDGDTMRMRAIPKLEIPPGGSVELKPGGYHLMLLGLKQPLNPDTSIPITLRFEQGGKAENLQITAPVRSLTTPAGGPAGGSEGHGR